MHFDVSFWQINAEDVTLEQYKEFKTTVKVTEIF